VKPFSAMFTFSDKECGIFSFGFAFRTRQRFLTLYTILAEFAESTFNAGLMELPFAVLTFERTLVRLFALGANNASLFGRRLRQRGGNSLRRASQR